MTWEEIIIKIRKDAAYKELVELAYFEEDLPLNVERFRHSEEYKETLRLIQEYLPGTDKRIADIGAGNGIASVAFALDGYHVIAVEPDPSDTIGAGAIRKLQQHYNLKNLEVVEAWGESLPMEKNSLDIVYIRQAVHHAAKLNDFISETARLLKPGGILFTVRDHVIYNEEDKQLFLKSHPLHKFYGGENAFTEAEYDSAISGAGLKVQQKLYHYDSVINYFPEKASVVEGKKKKRSDFIEQNWKKNIPSALRKIDAIKSWYYRRAESKLGVLFDASKIPGRLISYIARKPL